jgi:hypothetical protein
MIGAMHRVTTTLLALVAVSGTAHALTGTYESNNVPNSLYDSAASAGAQDLVTRVDEALNALTYTIYDTVPPLDWNDDTGVYKVDCTGYVNRMVEDAVPEAYDELGDARGTTHPAAKDYYYFFKSISIGGTRGRWRRPERVSSLRPGDLLVYRYKEDPGTGSTGHAMIVVGIPVKDSTRGSSIYRVRVSDSARSGHTRDNRDSDTSGVGAGEILVRVDSNGQPVSYTWSTTGPFHTDIYLAMGRPRY